MREEQAKSEQLLLNILPEPIAQRLKDKGEPISDGFGEVTILFADIVGFTPFSERLLPKDVVALLNDIFSRFDDLTERHRLEKIKTIGDSYMAVSGLPMPNENHAEAVAEMALDMVEELAYFNKQTGRSLDIRIGINSGSVVAGVIGKKKFTYDLWGDTVNTASRMEFHGVAGRIQVTESTHNRLRENYKFEERGVIPVKGKGEMRPTFLGDGGKVMRILSRLLSYLSASLGILIFVRSRSGKAYSVLMLSRGFAGALAPFLALAGGPGTLIGLARKDRKAACVGLLGTAIAVRHIGKITAQHSGFDRTFGPDWQSRISPELQSRMLPKRWTLLRQDPPQVPWQQDVVFGTHVETDDPLLADVWRPPQDVPPTGLAVVFLHGSGGASGPPGSLHTQSSWA